MAKASTDIRTEDTETLLAIRDGRDPRSGSHILRILADREIERRKAAI